MSPGMTASRHWASSFSRIGSGSLSGPWPGPVLSIFRGSNFSVNDHVLRFKKLLRPYWRRRSYIFQLSRSLRRFRIGMSIWD